ncbi:rod shape-determining protein RodA [Candidatus Falkowbacteria bacterium]|jgi:rod shape determining protein RodA|nr:rod shape-determining protein RodA [Candidatus Falkowbacteria bacterium]MBT7007653.1 rod shape-determining protein RodA [Candidatus Falkowbacteria bacterium]
MFKNFWDNLRKLDWPLSLAVLVLFCFGLAAIYSVSLSQQGDDFSNFNKQIAFGVIGLFVFLFFSMSNYSSLRVYSRVLYVAATVLLVGVLFFGSIIRGTKGWFNVGPINFQPVEFAKIVLVVVLAKFFSNRLQRFSAGKHVIMSLLITLSFVALVLFQPDLGSAFVLMSTWFILLVITGIPKKYLITLFIIFIIILLASWSFVLKDYQKERIAVFMNPSLDPLGSGYNVTQSIIGIGSGQFYGRGLGFGSQSQLKFIPESQTDFIFAVIAEELGFIGVSIILGLWAIIFYRLIVIAKKARDDFGMFLVLGVICVLFVHIFINIGMNMGIMPVTGISLPLLSYGGSFLLVTLVLLGMAQSVSVRR